MFQSYKMYIFIQKFYLKNLKVSTRTEQNSFPQVFIELKKRKKKTLKLS